MLIIRIIFAVFIIVSLTLLGCYFLFGEKKYLQYFLKTLTFTMYFLAILGVGMLVQKAI